MKKRFEIPVSTGDGLSEINLFAVDDFLRAMNSSEARRKLIIKVGGSRDAREAYEKKNGLPHGAVELVMLTEDKRFRDLDRVLRNRMPELGSKTTTPEAIEEIYRSSFSFARGMQQLYPDASDFLLQYALIAQRNRQRFLADFSFGNEYKLQMVEWCFPSCDGGLNCNTNININLTVNINSALFVSIIAAASAALALVFVVCVAIPVWPALYGAPIRLPKHT
jgi:hypothetical protein